jgi:hypothetical protein
MFEGMKNTRVEQEFSGKILVKPRQMELIEEQMQMLTSKSDSISLEF